MHISFKERVYKRVVEHPPPPHVRFGNSNMSKVQLGNLNGLLVIKILLLFICLSTAPRTSSKGPALTYIIFFCVIILDIFFLLEDVLKSLYLS